MLSNIITTEAELNDLMLLCQKQSWLAVDFEFHRRSTYYSKLCLIQLATLEWTAVVDVLAEDIQDRIADFLQNLAQCQQLVFYSPSQDFEIWQNLTDSVPDRSFDVQVAMALLGKGVQIGFSKAVELCLQVKMDKAHQQSDWRIRPLSSEQLNYAVQDAEQLARLYQYVLQHLSPEALQAVAEEMQETCRQFMTVKPKEQLWWRLSRKAYEATLKTQLKLQGLAIWREQQAMLLNKARTRILPDDVLIFFAQAPNLDPIKHYKYLKNAQKTSLKQAWQEAEQMTHEQLCLPKAFDRPSDSERAQIKQLQRVLESKGQAIGIKGSEIAGKDVLYHFICDPERSKLSSGWRRFVLGEDFFRRGKIDPS